MADRKISPELTIAMQLTEDERRKSLDLDVGYSELFDEWELIVRYSGDLEPVRQELNVSIEELLGGYAVVRIPQYLINRLASYPQIDYIEKPKALILEEMEGIAASCINRLRLPDLSLTGRGVLVACIDSGVDIYHPDFQNEDGTTRIVSLWDQTVMGNPPKGFRIGSVFDREEINMAIAARKNNQSYDVMLTYDGTGHGTAVLGILAGNGRSSAGQTVGVAPEAEILVVKLGNAGDRGFPRTTQLMLGLDYVVRYAITARKPMAVNVSFGNNYGAHNGDSIIEQYMNTIASLYRLSIVTGTGNEGISARHVSGQIPDRGEEIVEIYVGEYLTAFNLQIWKSFLDDVLIYLESPLGMQIGPFSSLGGVQSYELYGEMISVLYGEPTPYNPEQELYISWIPRQEYITPGIWTVRMKSRQIISGGYEMWLPVTGSTTSEVSFIRPVLSNTLTIPSTAQNVISVAAYDSRTDTYAPFSGRGPEGEPLYGVGGKPDLAAPGVNINTCRAGGGYVEVSGTSFAAPFVTGAATLLMQYGIVEGRDPYLYGEKLRVNLLRGARRLPFQEQRPSSLVGYGALCVSNSLPQ